LVFAFRGGVWVAGGFGFGVFEVFCLSLSWRCRFSQDVDRAGVQSKANKCCGFHFDLTGKGLSGSRFKGLGVVPGRLCRNTLNPRVPVNYLNLPRCGICFATWEFWFMDK